MHILKSVGVLSVAKISGLIYGCIALLFAPIFLLVAVLGPLTGQQQKTPFAGILGIVLAIALPIVYAIMGFIFGAIGAVLYNLFAKLTGGFELDLDPKPSGPVAPYPIVPTPTNPSIQS